MVYKRRRAGSPPSCDLRGLRPFKFRKLLGNKSMDELLFCCKRHFRSKKSVEKSVDNKIQGIESTLVAGLQYRFPIQLGGPTSELLIKLQT